ncbi:MAG: helix-turn-helix transcriptional regulator, partial [Candidatus Aenigmarchaeota archaeon]|nr:helix-turn-helix transcriptional regulator [Candidatus Aenigmarchaeota archaeon]
GTLYPLLRQLEQEGLIKISRIGKRSKNIFKLTSNGKNTIKQIRKYRKESREKFLLFRNLFLSILGEDELEMENVLFEIKNTAYKKFRKNKEKTRKILEKCLYELRRV